MVLRVMTSAGANQLSASPAMVREFLLDVTNLVVLLDGAPHPVTPEQARILRRLAAQNGGYVTDERLRKRSAPASEPGETIRRLPEPVRRLIESKRGPGGGRRLVLLLRIVTHPESTGESTQ